MLKTDLPDLFTIPKWYKNLFFVKRRPNLRYPRDWPTPDLAAMEIENPKTEAERKAKEKALKKYEQKLADEGFVSLSLFNDPSRISPELSADLRELQQHLLPRFWKLDQEARYYQNLHYLYQWVFIWGAFLTTVLAAFSVLLYQRDATNTATNIFGLVTAIIGAATGSVSFLETNQSPQRHWFEARTKAERLRSLYFLFLARQKPFDSPDPRQRLKNLRQMILRVQRPRSEDNGNP